MTRTPIALFAASPGRRALGAALVALTLAGCANLRPAIEFRPYAGPEVGSSYENYRYNREPTYPPGALRRSRPVYGPADR